MIHVSMCDKAPSCIKIACLNCHFAGAQVSQNILRSTKWTAVTVHVTGPAVDCSAKKNGPVIKLAVIPHQTVSLGECNGTGWKTWGIYLAQIPLLRVLTSQFR